MAKVQGFFSAEELDAVGIDGPGNGECDKCGLSTTCKTPQMGYTGQGQRGILIVAECPSEADDRSGAPMMGDTGLWFKDVLRKKGIDLEVDCWKTNAVACHPTKMKEHKPTKAHIKHCHPRLMKTIAELKPKFIWLLGADAITSYFSERENNCTVERWRGLCIPDTERGAWILPMYHPLFAIMKEKDNHFQSLFDKDLTYAIKCSRHTEAPEAMSLRGAKILKKYEDVVDALTAVIENPPDRMTLDYETTGLKPYRKDHKIASISFCCDYDTAYSFPYEYREHFTSAQLTVIGDLWIEILLNPAIKKIIHNQKFEDMWTREMFGIETANLWWCSMNTAHILDNRKEFCGLKFQSFIRWDIPDYSASISKFLKSVEGTPYNRVMEAPLNDLLLYGSIDSLLTFRLQEEQEHELKDEPNMQKAREFFTEGLKTLCDLQENGICGDLPYYLKQDLDIGERIAKMKENLHSMPEAQRFLRERGRNISFSSSTDLSDLFFTIMKLTPGKQTPGGANCVDASVLADLDTPIAKEITKISKLEKIKGTYLGQFIREIEDDGKIHPFFDIHTVQTYRSSSGNPNFQNIPVRDTEAMNIVRGGIRPSKGNQLVDWDYGAMEVRIIACVTQDPILMNYCNNLTTDMHRDQAMDSFSFTKAEWDALVLKDKRAAKDIRFVAKNSEVFAWFYGSYYGSSAKSIFPQLKNMAAGDMNLFAHLRNKGVIRSLSSAYKDFEDHLKRVEQRFWNKFKGVKAWQERAFKSYIEKGYIDLITGFRCKGWLSKNDICNYHIQGPAFHCLLWSLNTLSERMKEEQMRSKLNGQIHDCCLGDIVPDELDKWCHTSFEVATKEIKNHFTWLKSTTLLTEFEKAEINQPWSEKKEFNPHYL